MVEQRHWQAGYQTQRRVRILPPLGSPRLGVEVP
jgi:hypothetical protein